MDCGSRPPDRGIAYSETIMREPLAEILDCVEGGTKLYTIQPIAHSPRHEITSSQPCCSLQWHAPPVYTSAQGVIRITGSTAPLAHDFDPLSPCMVSAQRSAASRPGPRHDPRHTARVGRLPDRCSTLTHLSQPASQASRPLSHT